MIGIVVVTHGQLANELVTAAEMIVGDFPQATAVSIGWQVNPDDARREIEQAIDRADSGQGVVVLTDLFGGTPSRLSLALLEKGRVEVVSGVNLPMLIVLASLRQDPDTELLEMAKQTCARGRDEIHLASDLLRAKEDVKEDVEGKGEGTGRG